jgi:hypothetical protein
MESVCGTGGGVEQEAWRRQDEGKHEEHCTQKQA